MKSNLTRNSFRIYSERRAVLVCALSLLFLISGVGAGIVLAAEPQRLPTAHGGECAACHGAESQVLPEGHVDTKGMDLKLCILCHKEDDPKLANTLPLSHSHLLSGVSCFDCHGNADPPEFVGTDQCITCHNPDDLVEATKDNKEANPHNSPHYGPELDCDLCHHSHEPSENFCGQCHDFKFVVPSPMAKPAKKAAISSADQQEQYNRCVTCHSQPKYTDEFAAGVHGMLSCTTCHAKIDDMAAHMKKEQKPILTTSCASCHEKIASLFDNDIHAVKEGKTCQDCHTDIHTHKKLNSDKFKMAVIENCTQCHDKKQYVLQGHGKAVLEGNQDAATCSDCHGLHDIASYNTDNTEPNEGRSQGRVAYTAACKSCHGDEALTKRNNLSAMATVEYDETYHGKVLDIGSPECVAGCADCHNGHNILPPNDPESTIHQSDLVKDCKQCHEGFHQRFVTYEAHPDYRDRQRYPILFWTNVFMIVLLVSVFLFFWAHTILWWRKSYWEKWRGQKGNLLDESSMPEEDKMIYVQRFSIRDRLMHILLMGSFFTLVTTGFPLKYHGTAWAKVIVNLWGGVAMAGFFHRIAAALLIGLFTYTCWLSLRFLFPGGKVNGWLGRLFGPESLFFNLKDLDDLKGMFRWFFNRGEMPRFDRWTYWEKFDFFAVFWGMFAIGLSGLILWMPEWFSHVMPGWMINVATVVHSEEAFLAAIFIFTVHFFNNHLVPNKFPMESNIFTGRYSVSALKEERPEEYERIMAEKRLESLKREQPGVLSHLFAAFIGIASVLLGLLLTILIFWGVFFS